MARVPRGSNWSHFYVLSRQRLVPSNILWSVHLSPGVRQDENDRNSDAGWLVGNIHVVTILRGFRRTLFPTILFSALKDSVTLRSSLWCFPQPANGVSRTWSRGNSCAVWCLSHGAPGTACGWAMPYRGDPWPTDHRRVRGDYSTAQLAKLPIFTKNGTFKNSDYDTDNFSFLKTYLLRFYLVNIYMLYY